MTRAIWGVVAVAALAACGAKRSREPPREPSREAVGVSERAAGAAPSSDGPAKRAAPLAPPASYEVISLNDRTIGPFVARRGDVAMAAYLGTSEGAGRRLVSAPLTSTGDTRGDPRVVAPIATDATALVVRATGGAGAGFVAAWTSLTERGEALSVLGIDDAGAARGARGAPTELARSTDDIVWVDVVPTTRGAICVWAEETRTGDANVLAVALEPDGRMRGVPARVARGITGWQVTAAGQGAGLALVSASGDPPKKAPVASGTLSWLRLDVDGHPAGPPVAIASKPTVSGDVDVARLNNRFVFAWTDRTGIEPEVTLASIGDDGAVQAPRKPLVSAGGSALVAFTAGPAGALIAWDAPNRRGRSTRRVHLAHVDPLGELDGRVASVDLAGRGAPELAPTETGFALVGEVRPGDGAPVPTFVRFDANLTPLQTEPLKLGKEREPVQLAWGLSCAGDRCMVLTAAGAPARVRSVDLAPRATTWPSPVAPPIPADAPRLGVVTTLAQGEPFADVAVAGVDDGALVAMLTSAVDDATQRQRGESRGASLIVRPLDSKGAPSGPPVTLTSRALTVGGVAIAPGGAPEDGAAIAWVAREGGDPQVHVTRVDKRGRRQNDVQLTTAKGDASDVAIAWAGAGWLVAWVDGRAGNGEVFATKVGVDLARTAREERITDAPGDAGDVALLARGDTAWLAWSDPRESPQDGFADVFVTALHAKDAKRAGEDVRVLASAAHSRSPALAATSDGVAVGWIEEAPMGVEASASTAYGAMIARLDERGRPRGPIANVRGAGGGSPSAIALDAAGPTLRGVIARADKEELHVDAIELAPNAGAPRAFPLLALDGPPSLDVSLALQGGALYFNDDGPDTGDRRARRATILWRKIEPPSR
jgi:hypothetical protein